MDSPQRLYYVDWVRVLAFSVLIFFHCAMPFVSFDWEVKNPTSSIWLSRIILWLHQWRIPLLFFISGTGIFFSLNRRSLLFFAGERIKRLFIPLLFAMFFTIPLQVYYERMQRGQFRGSYSEFYPSVWTFIPYPDGTLAWSHMWFVVYLFVFCMLLLPVFGILKIPSLERFKQRVSLYLSHPYRILLPTIPLMLLYFNFFIEYPEHQSLLDDWFLFLFSLILLFYGYLLGGLPAFWEVCEKFRRFYFSIGVICIVLLFIFYWWQLDLPAQKNVRLYTYGVLNALHIWCLILSVLGFARHHLNFSNRFLKYANEAVYPFYIIHQTLIVAIGYYVVQWDLSIGSKIIILCLLSLLAIGLTYQSLVKPFLLTRFLFGMKNSKSRTRVSEAIPSEI